MPAQRSGASVVAFVFFCSGAIALVYEVIWQRQFALLFGSGAPATAMVLAAYFAGLGLGSFLFGRWANRWTSPLSAYAVLEFTIALGAMLVAPVLSIYENWYPEIVSSFGQNSTTLLAIKGLLASAAILIPTTAMGGTLPVLAELVDRGKQHLGLTVGWLYVVNTAGAALGAISVPLLLLPALGTKRTVFLCAAANALIGAAALGARRLWKSEAVTTGAKPAKPTRAPQRAQPLLVLAFASGAGLFALQVLWNRAFAQIHENSIYSFAGIVTVFILAIALGAQAARWLLRKDIRFEKALGVTWVFGGLAVAFCPVLFVHLTDGLNYLRGDARNSLGNLLALGGTLMLLPTALLAAGLPLLMEKAGATTEQSAGYAIGRLLGINITGSIAGALLAGFALPKLLGLWSGMMAVGAAFACFGTWVFCKSTATRIFGTAALVLLALLLIPRLRDDLPRTHLDAKRGERLLAVEEGAYGIVAVTERADSRRLKLNNRYTLGGTFATGDERVQAHIPLLIHPQPRRVAFLGFGTGITAGGALFHPTVKIDAVELVPEIARLASRYFAEANGDFHRQANTHMILDDARNFLRGSPTRYDVIISDIVVPWQQGEAALYTREHFAAAKRALNSNGVFCAWLPAFQLGETEFQILLRTFVSVFGVAQVWRGDFSPNRPAIALIFLDPMPAALDAGVIQRRLAEMIPDPSNPHLRDPRAFWMHFMGVVRNEDIHEQRINSEDRPWLELRPLRSESTAMTGRKLIEWSRGTPAARAETITQLSPEAASGYQGGRIMVEFTQATLERDQQRAAESRARLRDTVGEETFRLLFGVP